MTSQIRRCVAGDAQALALVGQATFLESFAGILNGSDILAHCAHQHAETVYRDWLARSDMHLWLAEALPGQAAVGYVVLAPAALPLADLQPGELEIKRIYLLHRFQGGGLGRRLMDSALAQARAAGCRRVLLGVKADNHAALAFYDRVGFGVVGRRSFTVGQTVCEDLILARALDAGA